MIDKPWEHSALYVLKTLETHQTHFHEVQSELKDMASKLDALRVDVTKLQVRAGLAGGIVAALINAAAMAVIKWLF